MYLALGLGIAGVPRGFSSFRPGMSDIFLRWGMLDGLDGVTIPNGSVSLRRRTEVWKGRDPVSQSQRIWDILMVFTQAIRVVNRSFLALQGV